MSRIRVVLHPTHPRGVAEALAEIQRLELVQPEDDTSVGEALDTAPVLVSFRWSPSYLTPSLRWIQSISAGVDQFPLDELARSDVILTSARGIHARQVAEHAFALLLALTRGVGIAMREAQDRRWRPRMGHELAGRTLGVLGLGSIGEEVARRSVAWGMEVVGTKADPATYNGVASQVWGPDRTLEVFRQADAVVVVLPDTSATRHLVGAAELDALGAGWIVNVGRGSSLDERALIRALDEGELRGAGLDVFEEEPLPADSPLWSHPRVVLTPHTAGLSPAYGSRLAEVLERNLDAFLGHGEWVNRVV